MLNTRDPATTAVSPDEPFHRRCFSITRLKAAACVFSTKSLVSCPRTAHSPLHYAVEVAVAKDRLAIVQLLIGRGASPAQLDSTGQSATDLVAGGSGFTALELQRGEEEKLLVAMGVRK